MGDTATACDNSNPDAIGLWLWIFRTLPRAVACPTRVCFGALGPDLRYLAHEAFADLLGLPSCDALWAPIRKSLLRPQGSPSEQRASVAMRRAATRWSRS